MAVQIRFLRSVKENSEDRMGNEKTEITSR
jgi:hypothetical protein